MFDRRLIQNFDWVLLLLLLLLAAISITNLYSATYPIRNAGGAQVFAKQIYWFMIGFTALLMMTTFNYSVLERFAYPVYYVVVVLLIGVLFAGKVISGSQRWLSFGGFSIQPSELAKIAVVILLAKFFSEKNGHQGYRLKDLWQIFLLVALPCGLIIKEPDLGTALLLSFVSFSLILFANIYWKSLLVLVGSAISVAPFIWMHLKDYQRMRILTFVRPDMDPLGSGYHINQSKIAIGSGLLWGKGFLKGTQTRLHFLPEQHTDFAFSVLAEEWGFIGSAFLLLLYLFIVLWGLNIAKNSKDRFGSLLAVGVVSVSYTHLRAHET